MKASGKSRRSRTAMRSLGDARKIGRTRGKGGRRKLRSTGDSTQGVSRSRS